MPTGRPSLTIFADDLTGALDTGVKFAGEGRLVAVHWDGPPPPCDVLVIDTDSRCLAPLGAAQVIARWAPQAAGDVYKKVDSTLRGPFAAELAALVEYRGCRGALLAPTLPSAGRTVRDGVLLVCGTRLAETAFRDDPVWPAASSQIRDLVRDQWHGPTSLLPLSVVRRGAEAIREALAACQGIVIADAETDGDLDHVAGALARQPDWLPAGSAGLAEAVARARGWKPPSGTQRFPVPHVFLCGSLHSSSRGQMTRLEAAWDLALAPRNQGTHGGTTMAYPGERSRPELYVSPSTRLSPDEAVRCLDQVVALAAEAALSGEAEALYVTGGETLRRLASRLGIRSLFAVAEASPGVVYSRARLADGREMALFSKAGGFGADDLLVDLFGPVAVVDTTEKEGPR